MKKIIDLLFSFIAKYLTKIVLIIFLALLFSMFYLDYSTFLSVKFKNNFSIFSSTIITGAICLISYVMFTAYIGKKYSLRIDKLSLGGLNILFDTSRTLYTNSISNFLDSKRTLFKIEPKYDNFSDLFESYLQTYNFFRQEMKILDPKRDKDLYDLTNHILQELNKFLTKNQNNYRRWYQKISTDNTTEYFTEGSGKYFYNTPIHEIQKTYYAYDELLNSFKEINNFFENNVKEPFEVNSEKWNW
ncbi:hypothetical protein ACG94X_12545 [Acinetobacter sp. ULE_I010]|uniref:hypothetical protein n=1 Tax=Acinetobacter sp. ULE_I010 TaxID=3373065 RepID=UPI003AF6BCE6